MNTRVPVIAITDSGSLIFQSVEDCAVNYECRKSDIIKLIATGNLHKDRRTTFDYYDGPNE